MWCNWIHGLGYSGKWIACSSQPTLCLCGVLCKWILCNAHAHPMYTHMHIQTQHTHTHGLQIKVTLPLLPTIASDCSLCCLFAEQLKHSPPSSPIQTASVRMVALASPTAAPVCALLNTLGSTVNSYCVSCRLCPVCTTAGEIIPIAICTLTYVACTTSTYIGTLVSIWCVAVSEVVDSTSPRLAPSLQATLSVKMVVLASLALATAPMVSLERGVRQVSEHLYFLFKFNVTFQHLLCLTSLS